VGVFLWGFGPRGGQKTPVFLLTIEQKYYTLAINDWFSAENHQ
jgi:hypothetical protein